MSLLKTRTLFMIIRILSADFSHDFQVCGRRAREREMKCKSDIYTLLFVEHEQSFTYMPEDLLKHYHVACTTHIQQFKPPAPHIFPIFCYARGHNFRINFFLSLYDESNVSHVFDVYNMEGMCVGYIHSFRRFHVTERLSD